MSAILNTIFNSVVGFVIVLGVIIFIHEMGHLLVAKAFGMRVFIFSFGFGKRLCGFKWGDTDCRLSAFPLGGYVKLEGEPDDRLSESTSTEKAALADGEIVDIASPRYFLNRPRWQRFLVYLAGPAMNVVLTLVLFTTLFKIGWGMDATLYDPPVIGAVEAGSPAAQAGFLPADRIVSINQTPQKTWEDALLNIVLRPGTTLEVRVRRGDEEKDLRLAPKTDQQSRTAEPGVYPLVRVGTVEPGLPAASAGVTFDDGILEIDGKPVRSFGEIPSMIAAAAGRPLALKLLRGDRVVELIVTPRGGRIGISNKRIVRKLGWLGATSAAWGETWRQTRQILTMLKGIVTAKVSARASLSGPIGIAMASGDAVRRGVLDTILLLAMVSIGVGLLNLFPLAPLDGGHLAILAAEGVIRRDLSVTVKTWIMNLGVAVVLLLVVVTLYSDLSKTAWLSKYLP